MSITASPGGVDLLTRTTLQLDGSTSAASIAQVIQTLQRVPGVLFAEVDAASGRTTIAHDAGVPAAALLAAANGVGVHAGIVASPSALPIKAGADLRFNGALMRRRMFVWVVIFVAAWLIEALVPDSPEKHWLVPILMTAFWLSFLITRIFGPHRA